MTGRWQGSTRKSTLPPDWPQRVAAVKRRSGGICEWIKKSTGRRCTNPANGGVDHFKSRDYHELDGLRDSCHFHHSKKSSQEGNDAKAALKAQRNRPEEPHPGERRR